MSKTRRVWNIIGAVFEIITALLLMLVPDLAFEFIAIIIAFILLIYGIKYIVYYLTHAQHMIGGKWLLLVGLILFDMSVFLTILDNVTQPILIIYIVVVHFVAAIVNFARAVSNKGDGNPGWTIDLAQGIGNFAQVVLCLVFIKWFEVPVFIYCSGLIYSAILTIIASCKRTAIIYVQ